MVEKQNRSSWQWSPQCWFSLNVNDVDRHTSNYHLFKVSGRLNLPDGLHESVSDNNTDVRSRIAPGALAQGDKVCLR